jgi:hypothetical protein
MSRILVIAAVLGSCFLIWKSGALDGAIGSVIPGSPTTAATPLDPGVEISKSSTVMQNLNSMHLSITGNMVLNRIAGVTVTGSGDLSYPHKEKMSFQFQVPTASGTAILAMNERIEGGHEYIQFPSQSQTWKDVTGNTKSQILPEMDPIANLEFAQAFRASDDLGDITMDNIDVHHFSLTVDPGKYVAKLKADPNSGITPADEAILTGSTIQVEVWLSASDRYIHQMKIDWVNSQFTWDVTYHYSNFVTGGGTTSA